MLDKADAPFAERDGFFYVVFRLFVGIVRKEGVNVEIGQAIFYHLHAVVIIFSFPSVNRCILVLR